MRDRMRAFTSSHNAVWRFCAASPGGLFIKVRAAVALGPETDARCRRSLPQDLRSRDPARPFYNGRIE